MTKRTKKVKALEGFDTCYNKTWTLPRTAADYDAMVEQMTQANLDAPGDFADGTRAALRAIGITRPSK